MEITETLYVKDRKQWRAWLAKNHKTAKDIWLIYNKKHSRKPRIPYNDAVEEALCYGWIDSTTKPFNEEAYVQRFSPRRKNSGLSEMNKERVNLMIAAGKMTASGLESIQHHMDNSKESSGTQKFKEFKMPKDILKKLKADPVVWQNFEKFPEHYKHIRIGFIDGARNRPEEFEKRLRYFIKMTAQNKKYGMVQ
jgi:uncharacterized protein YdeI (YjbR/CyaY-like superfamily)